MRKIVVLLLSMCLTFVSVPFVSGHAMEIEDINFRQIQIDEYTTRTVIHKYSKRVKVNGKLQALIQEGVLNRQLTEQSCDIIMQKQILLNPTGYEMTISENGVEKQVSTQGSWSDNEERLTIYTTAYKLGYDQEGDAIYTIEGRVQIHNPFRRRNQEQLVLHHSASGSYKPSSSSGQQGYHESYEGYNPYTGGHSAYERDVINDLTPQFSSIYGVNFAFKFPKDYNHSGTGGGVTIWSRAVYTNLWCVGQYDVIVSGKTNVQTCYYHNEEIMGGNLSVSFSAYGVGLSVNVSGSCTKYEAEPILLYNE